MNIDETDKKIMNLLIEDSRLSIRDISKKTGFSAVTILKRFNKLKKEKIINSFSANPDYEKLGYEFNTIIQVRVSKGKLEAVGKKIMTHKNVYAIYDITGDFDIMVHARFKSRKSLDTFVKKIQVFEYVERTQTILVLNTIKEKNIKIE